MITKLYKVPVFLFLVCFFSFGNVRKTWAQTEAPASVVTAGIGFSLAGVIISAYETAVTAAANTANNIQATSSSIPVIFGSYDYSVNHRFSIGIAGSYQSWGIAIPAYVDNGGTAYSASALNISRTNYALRPLIHLGNSSDLDMYIGARLGYTTWNTAFNSNDPNLTGVKFGTSSNFAPAVLFGVRYFFIKNLGISAELSLGAPYAFAFGLNGRF